MSSSPADSTKTIGKPVLPTCKISPEYNRSAELICRTSSSLRQARKHAPHRHSAGKPTGKQYRRHVVTGERDARTLSGQMRSAMVEGGGIPPTDRRTDRNSCSKSQLPSSRRAERINSRCTRILTLDSGIFSASVCENNYVL